MQYCIVCGQLLGEKVIGPEGICTWCHPVLPERESKELLTYALKIAHQQRGEEHLQDLETLQKKFDHEIAEFNEELRNVQNENQWLDLLSEAADLVYYGAQLDHYGVNVRPHINALLYTAHIPPWTAMKAALIKYESRSAGKNKKDKDTERELLRQCL